MLEAHLACAYMRNSHANIDVTCKVLGVCPACTTQVCAPLFLDEHYGVMAFATRMFCGISL